MVSLFVLFFNVFIVSGVKQVHLVRHDITLSFLHFTSLLTGKVWVH